jgi:hypothetical protein
MVGLGWLTINTKTRKILHFTAVVQKEQELSKPWIEPSTSKTITKLAKTSSHRLYIRPHLTLNLRGNTGLFSASGKPPPFGAYLHWSCREHGQSLPAPEPSHQTSSLFAWCGDNEIW